jgi:hypothetical protein
VNSQPKPVFQERPKHRKEARWTPRLISFEIAGCLGNNVKPIRLEAVGASDNLLFGFDRVGRVRDSNQLE